MLPIAYKLNPSLEEASEVKILKETLKGMYHMSTNSKTKGLGSVGKDIFRTCWQPTFRFSIGLEMVVRNALNRFFITLRHLLTRMDIITQNHDSYYEI